MSVLATLDNWISVSESAARIGMSRRQIRNYIYQGRVAFTRKSNKEYLIYWPSLEKLRNSRSSPLMSNPLDDPFFEPRSN